MSGLAEFEKQYFKRRRLSRTLAYEFTYAFSLCFDEGTLISLRKTPLWRATVNLLRDLDKTEVPANVTYHNHLHFADAMSAAAFLSQREPELSVNEKMELIAVMAAHDIYHDGTVNTDVKCLEQISADSFIPYMQSASVAQEQIASVVNVILSTDPRQSSRNKLNYIAAKSRTDVLAGLAHDADLLASWLPSTGLQNGASLAVEWSYLEDFQLKNAASFVARAGFLSVVKPITRAAHNANITQICEAQLEALSTFSPSSQEKNPHTGAAFLDSLERSVAETLYLRATQENQKPDSVTPFPGSL